MKRSYENHQNELNQSKDGGTANRTVKQPECQSSTDADEDEMLFSLLPPEIITLILWRLSINTLFVLKCVCKFFSHFISSQDFTRTHLKLSSDDVSSSHNKVIVKSLGPYSKLEETSIQSLFRHDYPIHSVNLDYPEKQSRTFVGLVGSCNGLVSIIVGKNMFIWNPAIRIANKLPDIRKLEYLRNKDVDDSMCFCGFGYDVSNDDYKVLALVAYTDFVIKSKKRVCYVINVYSLKRNSWNRLPDCTCGELMKNFAKFASGKLHWLTTSEHIVSFDIEREVFGTVEQPTYAKGYRNVKLSVLQGSICVCCDYISHVDVWVMKEYGNKESWTKMFTCSGVGSPNVSYMLPNGEVILDNGPLVIYDPRNNSSRSIVNHYFFDPLIYVESPVLPFRERTKNTGELKDMHH